MVVADGCGDLMDHKELSALKCFLMISEWGRNFTLEF